MMTVLTIPQFLKIILWLFVCVMDGDAGHPEGVEFKSLQFCGPRDETAKVKISPWPFLPSGKICNLTLQFTPAVDVFAASVQGTVTIEPGGQTLVNMRDDLCRYYPEFCSLQAGETFVWTLSGKMRAIPSQFKMMARIVLEAYNEEHIMFLCLDAVAKLYDT